MTDYFPDFKWGKHNHPWVLCFNFIIATLSFLISFMMFKLEVETWIILFLISFGIFGYYSSYRSYRTCPDCKDKEFILAIFNTEGFEDEKI